MPLTVVSGHLQLLGVPLIACILKESAKLIGLKLHFLFCFAIWDGVQAKHLPNNLCVQCMWTIANVRALRCHLWSEVHNTDPI